MSNDNPIAELADTPYNWRIRRWYKGLTEQERHEICLGYERHRRACHSLEIEPEPDWIAEAVVEQRRKER